MCAFLDPCVGQWSGAKLIYQSTECTTACCSVHALAAGVAPLMAAMFKVAWEWQVRTTNHHVVQPYD